MNILSYSYKWTIPVQWNSPNTNKNSTMMFDKGQTGTSMESSSFHENKHLLQKQLMNHFSL